MLSDRSPLMHMHSCKKSKFLYTEQYFPAFAHRKTRYFSTNRITLTLKIYFWRTILKFCDYPLTFCNSTLCASWHSYQQLLFPGDIFLFKSQFWKLMHRREKCTISLQLTKEVPHISNISNISNMWRRCSKYLDWCKTECEQNMFPMCLLISGLNEKYVGLRLLSYWLDR